MTFTAPQFKAEYQTECLIEICNDQFKVNAIESGHNTYYQLEYEVGRKYIKVWSYLMSSGERVNGRGCFMFVDKKDGACYKPASYKAPAKGIRFWIDQLLDNPEIVDQYGSFLYVR